LLHNADGRFFQQILFRMWHGDQSGFGRMLEVMMAAFDPYQIPTVCDELAD